MQVSDAAIQAYYDAHKAQFMTPESVHLQYAQLTLAQVTAQITVTDADLQDYYTKNKNRYISTEQRHAHHILVAVNDESGCRRGAEEGPGHRGEAEGGRQFRGAGQAVFR